MAIKGRIKCENCKFCFVFKNKISGACSAFQNELSAINSERILRVIVDLDSKCYKFIALRPIEKEVKIELKKL